VPSREYDSSTADGTKGVDDRRKGKNSATDGDINRKKRETKEAIKCCQEPLRGRSARACIVGEAMVGRRTSFKKEKIGEGGKRSSGITWHGEGAW